MMCLLLSLLGNQDDTIDTGSLFEKVSAVAIDTYIGGKSIAFGIEKPTVQSVAVLLNERFASEPRGNWNDRGVDVISWKTFNDSRSNQLVVLTQSASGWNWRKKTRQISRTVWGQYIHWAAPPILSFAIPGIIAESYFHDVAAEAEAIILDRPRLYKYSTNGMRQNLNREIINWCNRNFER